MGVTDKMSVRVADLNEIRRQIAAIHTVACSGRLRRGDAARIEGAARAIDDVILSYLQLSLPLQNGASRGAQ